MSPVPDVQRRPEPALGLIGRRHELDLVDSLVHSLADGNSGCLILVGEAGIGKSTLTRVASTAASERDIRSLTAAGLPLSIERPLQPILDAFDQLDHDGGAAAEPRPDTPARTLLESSVGDPVALLLQRVIDRLDAMVSDEPLLVVVEDLHWADPTTLTLIHHHLTRLDRQPLAIIATARPPVPGTPLHHLIAAAGPAVIEITGLDDTSVDALVSAAVDGDTLEIDQGALSAAQGNPLLIEAVVRRHLAHTPGTPDHAEPAYGATAHRHGHTDPITAIVRSMPPEVSSVLHIAAVAGDQIRVELLASVAALSVPDVIERLERARTGGVVDVVDGGFAFRHALYRETLLTDVPGGARAALHLEVARVLELFGAPTLEIAEHLTLGARPGNRAAVDQLTTAAEETAKIDPSTALQITERALALVDGGDVPTRLHVVRVTCLAACGRAAEADALGSSLLQGSEIDSAIEAKVRRELALAAFVEGRASDAEAHMARVVELASDSEAAARAVTEQAWARMLSLDRDGAWEGAHRGVQHGDAATRISAESLRCWLGLWRLDSNTATAAAQYLETTVGLRPRGDWQIFQPLLGAAAVRLEHEDYERAVTNAETGRQLAMDAGSSWAAPAYDALSASTSFRRGDLDLATSQALAALDGTAIVDSFGVEIWSRSLLAQIALRQRHVQLARHHVETASLAAEDGRAQLGIDHLVIAEAAVHLVDGDQAAAVKTLDDGWLFLSAVGIHFVRGIVGVELVKLLCSRDERRDDASAIATDIDADAGLSGLPLLVGAAARARAWLEPTPSNVRAAVDAAMASQNVVLRVDTLTDARHLAPQDPSARAWSTELDRLLALMGCTLDPKARGRTRRRRPEFGPGSLTDAERRVALLVAEGLTNTKIAEQLVVSRRTVDTQVLSAYRKLGVNTRVGLTRALLVADT